MSSHISEMRLKCTVFDELYFSSDDFRRFVYQHRFGLSIVSKDVSIRRFLSENGLLERYALSEDEKKNIEEEEEMFLQQFEHDDRLRRSLLEDTDPGYCLDDERYREILERKGEIQYAKQKKVEWDRKRRAP